MQFCYRKRKQIFQYKVEDNVKIEVLPRRKQNGDSVKSCVEMVNEKIHLDTRRHVLNNSISLILTETDHFNKSEMLLTFDRI